MTAFRKYALLQRATVLAELQSAADDALHGQIKGLNEGAWRCRRTAPAIRLWLLHALIRHASSARRRQLCNPSIAEKAQRATTARDFAFPHTPTNPTKFLSDSRVLRCQNIHYHLGWLGEEVIGCELICEGPLEIRDIDGDTLHCVTPHPRQPPWTSAQHAASHDRTQGVVV